MKNAEIKLRISEREKEKIKSKAEQMQMSMSEYILYCVRAKESKIMVKRNNEDYKITDMMMDTIASYMDDDIREELHSLYAPCSHEEFLKEYIKRDESFEDLLKNEFDIKLIY